MGPVCCINQSDEQKTVDVHHVYNNHLEEENNNSKNASIENNAIIICRNKTINEINYSIRYKPKVKKT